MEITKDNSLIILDWDDTLFPTSWTVHNKINMSSKERYKYSDYFNHLDRVLYNFFKKIIVKMKVIIVTNALHTWINLSSEAMPNTFNILKNIEIISARLNHKKHSNNISDWKLFAFKKLITREFRNKKMLNVMSVGDADYEYKALISIDEHQKNKKRYLKSIRFLTKPTHEMLIEQIQILHESIDKICYIQNHLDLEFNKIK
jgi:hypothetical protein